ncbi:hypothetical protein Hrd1104_04050 [Halorhabdus sp. CBA1104]|uniref:hypothetical protein n=1 Tax=Halorhabdus sp. CBA1104 TaxID=1380432 RepID=UPI0012B2830A|nr:hypothetical protein [Halorhabdus sp. CBA1104]QGN06551.1 hypothetical protein Hrd1104_04050 [Halorhabdus sp. CBA1104]
MSPSLDVNGDGELSLDVDRPYRSGGDAVAVEATISPAESAETTALEPVGDPLIGKAVETSPGFEVDQPIADIPIPGSA